MQIVSLVPIGILFCVISQITGEIRDQVPSEAPGNLTLLEVEGRQVVIEWDPVSPDTVRGHFRGYLVRTWNHAGSQVYAFPPDVTKVNVEFFPYSKNFITVSARNEKYVGPPSEAIRFDAPQIASNSPYLLNVYPLSEKSVLLQWSKPTQPNGVLLGYKIYCGILNTTRDYDGELIETRQVSHQIYDPDKLQAKLTGMLTDVKYRIAIAAINCAGESERKTTEITLEPHSPAEPFPSKLVYKIGYQTIDSEKACAHDADTDDDYDTIAFTTQTNDIMDNKDNDYFDNLHNKETEKENVKVVEANHPSSHEEEGKNCLVDCMVQWIPDVKNNPGENFQLKYRQRGENEFQTTDPEVSEDFVILREFNACKNYELIVTAIDGNYTTDSSVFVTPTKMF